MRYASGHRLFFFGTLVDRPLFRTVIGHDGADLAFRPAKLPGHRAEFAEGQDFPILVPDDDAATPGLVVEPLSDGDVERIQFFEDIDYHLEEIEVVAHDDGMPVRASFFKSAGTLRPSGTPWQAENWAERHRRRLRLLAAEHMQHFGRLSFAEIDRLWPELVAKVDRQLAEADRK